MLSPQARAALAAVAGQTPVHDPSFDIDADRAASRAAAAQQPKEPVASVRDVDADGVPCRLYVPEGAHGVVVLLHGGGFVFHDVDVYDAPARRLANRSGAAVLSVDYRRPPEHRFPAAPDDVDTAIAWLDAHREQEGLRGPVFVHGDSAGANLALVAALRNPGRFAAVVLVYPFLDPEAGYDSYRTEAHGMDAAEGDWYWQQYAASEADLRHPDLAPLRSDRLHTLPPTLVVTGEHDPLRDEGERLAAELAELGVDVVGTRYLGQVHGFWRHFQVFPQAEALTRQVAGFLRTHL
ncbi:alpha/beta hydrolase [Nocardioides sp. MAHUQ-72]|uniref:alpha/beta hydrolase n=1 Tax=unclassified Nocardioides TaxID=2615069 RepID=UPI003623E972